MKKLIFVLLLCSVAGVLAGQSFYAPKMRKTSKRHDKKERKQFKAKSYYLKLRADLMNRGVKVDSVNIGYGFLGLDTLGRSDRFVDHWRVLISDSIESDIEEAVVYHEVGHVMGLRDGDGELMDYYRIVPLNVRRRERFVELIVKAN